MPELGNDVLRDANIPWFVHWSAWKEVKRNSDDWDKKAAIKEYPANHLRTAKEAIELGHKKLVHITADNQVVDYRLMRLGLPPWACVHVCCQQDGHLRKTALWETGYGWNRDSGRFFWSSTSRAEPEQGDVAPPYLLKGAEPAATTPAPCSLVLGGRPGEFFPGCPE